MTEIVNGTNVQQQTAVDVGERPLLEIKDLQVGFTHPGRPRQGRATA